MRARGPGDGRRRPRVKALQCPWVLRKLNWVLSQQKVESESREIRQEKGMQQVHRREVGGYKIDKGGKNRTPAGSTWWKNEAVGEDRGRGQGVVREVKDHSEGVEE